MEHRLLKINPGGQKFIDRVSTPATFKAYMLVKAPVLGVTGAYLDELAAHGSRMVVPFGRRTKDLFGNVFTSALMAAAEIASASMIVLHIRNQDAPLTSRLVGFSCEAEEELSSDATVLCHDGLGYAEFVERIARSGEPDRETFEARIVDASGTVTHRLELTWELSRKS